MEGYKYSGPKDLEKEISSNHLKGKTAIVTGGNSHISIPDEVVCLIKITAGANGIGEAYTRGLVAAGYESPSSHSILPSSFTLTKYQTQRLYWRYGRQGRIKTSI
jgi:hypothetical protein